MAQEARPLNPPPIADDSQKRLTIRLWRYYDQQIVVPLPGVAGLVTDKPSWALSPQESYACQDMISPTGVLSGRYGWTYDGTTADSATANAAVARAYFTMQGAAVSLVLPNTGSVAYVHNPSAAGTLITNLSGAPLFPAGGTPRCVYRGELIITFSDGKTGVLRYSGSNVPAPGSPVATVTTTVGQSILTATSGSFGTIPPGHYVYYPAAGGPGHYGRVSNSASTTQVTLENVVTSTAASASAWPSAFGLAYPAVSVYEAGTASVTTGGSVTGVGTKWVSQAKVGFDEPDTIPSNGTAVAILVRPVGASRVAYRTTGQSSSETAFPCASTVAYTNVPYSLLSRCPARDATVYRNSLVLAGNTYWTNRVYIGPPGWDPATPPGSAGTLFTTTGGYAIPFDPSVNPTSLQDSYFLLQYIDVPVVDDGDPIVAVTSDQSGILVWKRRSLHLITGAYPSFTSRLVASGTGCIDIRSAQSTPYGQFALGERGIYWWTGGKLHEITEGKIGAAYRALARGFTPSSGSYPAATLGVTSRYLVAAIWTSSSTGTTWVYDLHEQTWVSTLSNVRPVFMWASQLPGESEKLLWVDGGNHPGRVMDLAPALNQTGTGQDGDTAGPTPKWQSGYGITHQGGVDPEAAIIQVAVDHKFDLASGAQTMNVVNRYGGGLNQTTGLETTATLGTITGQSTNTGTERREMFDCNNTGRRQSLALEASGPWSTNVTRLELHQLVLRVRGSLLNT